MGDAERERPHRPGGTTPPSSAVGPEAAAPDVPALAAVRRSLRRLQWILNRLRAMSLAEVRHRVARRLADQHARRRGMRGRMGDRRAAVRPKCSLFPVVDGWHSSRGAGACDEAAVRELIDGRVRLFGRATYDLGRTPDWHRDPKTGVRSPSVYGRFLNYRDPALVGDVKVVWELGRHQHLIPVAVAYARTGQPLYRSHVQNQIAEWIEQNPFALGIHWCSTLEVALRLIAWALIHSLLALRDGDEGLFRSFPVRDKLERTIFDHAWFIREHLSRYSSANNHLLGEVTGLWVACNVFDLGADGPPWARFAHAEIEREAQLQVSEDGVNREQAFHYHLDALECLLLAWIVGQRAGEPFSEALRQKIIAMADFLACVSPPGGTPPQIGDADDGCVVRFDPDWPEQPFHEVVTSVGIVFDRPDLVSRLPARHSEKPFWYASMCGIPTPAPAAESGPLPTPIRPRLFAHGGYAVLVSERLHICYDVGPLGYLSIAAHGHADALSVCVAVDGQWWIVDPGTYAYHDDARWREYFRGTRAHNTVVVDGRDQSVGGGPFLWLRHARAEVTSFAVSSTGTQIVAGRHDGYAALGVIHRRRVECEPDRHVVTITDRLEGHGPHDITTLFHFHPDVAVCLDEASGRWIATRAGSRARLVLTVSSRPRWTLARGQSAPILGWYSAHLGLKTPTYTLFGQSSLIMPATLPTEIRLLDG